MWKILAFSILPSRYENALQTNRDISIDILYNMSLTGGKESFCQRRSSKTPQNKLFKQNIWKKKEKKKNMENFINMQHNLRSEISRKDTSPPPTKQNKETNLSLCNTMLPSRSKSERNPNKDVVPNAATTIAKPNFQGVAHTIIQKGTFTQRHTCKSKIITKARKPNPIFWSREGLSTHVNKLINKFWAYFLDFSRQQPPPVSNHFVVHQGWSLWESWLYLNLKHILL